MFGRLKGWWESICLECGQCCCEKYPYRLARNSKRRLPGVRAVSRRYFIDYRSPCRYLEIERGRCMVYEKRFRECENCIPMTIFSCPFCRIPAGGLRICEEIPFLAQKITYNSLNICKGDIL